MSERGTPWTASNLRKVLQRLAAGAKRPISVNPHALRHACGFKLAAYGVDTGASRITLGIAACNRRNVTARTRADLEARLLEIAREIEAVQTMVWLCELERDELCADARVHSLSVQPRRD